MVNGGTPVHGSWTYGHYCGAGGSGLPINDTDWSCAGHDVCFDMAGIDARAQQSGVYNRMPQRQRNAMQQCNQNLCDNISTVDPHSRAEMEADSQIEWYFHPGS